MAAFNFLSFQTIPSEMSEYEIFPSTQPAFEGRPLRIALFDLDGTLITSKSGRRIAQDGSDWVFFGSSVPAVLQRYATEGWIIAIVTNQANWFKRDGAARSKIGSCLLYTSPSPRDLSTSRMPSSA